MIYRFFNDPNDESNVIRIQWYEPKIEFDMKKVQAIKQFAKEHPSESWDTAIESQQYQEENAIGKLSQVQIFQSWLQDIHRPNGVFFISAETAKRITAEIANPPIATYTITQVQQQYYDHCFGDELPF